MIMPASVTTLTHTMSREKPAARPHAIKLFFRCACAVSAGWRTARRISPVSVPMNTNGQTNQVGEQMLISTNSMFRNRNASPFPAPQRAFYKKSPLCGDFHEKPRHVRGFSYPESKKSFDSGGTFLRSALSEPWFGKAPSMKTLVFIEWRSPAASPPLQG